MLEEIAQNEHYKVGVDTARNILYLSVTGFWKEEQTAQDYVSSLEKAADKITGDFAVVADLTEMETPLPRIGEYHENAQRLMVEKGLKHTAEIWPSKAILQMALQRYAKLSGNPVNGFSAEEGKDAAIKEAESWLYEQGYR